MRKLVLIGLYVLTVVVMAGCQVSVTTEASLFYPDNLGQKHIGDPRRPVFESSTTESRQAPAFVEHSSTEGK